VSTVRKIREASNVSAGRKMRDVSTMRKMREASCEHCEEDERDIM